MNRIFSISLRIFKFIAKKDRGLFEGNKHKRESTYKKSISGAGRRLIRTGQRTASPPEPWVRRFPMPRSELNSRKKSFSVIKSRQL